jgi:hypothetical protein
VGPVSATDAWATGYYTNSSGVDVPLMLHWNGTTWTKEKSPPPRGAQNSYLYGVSADSATDIWAAGYTNSGAGSTVPNKTWLPHWNGTTWTKVKSPSPTKPTLMSFWLTLRAVSAVSKTDAWAAGAYENSSGVIVPLMLHWNGTTWTKVKTTAPSSAHSIFLYGVSADSATDAWAVGYYTHSSGVGETLILHWNGTAWKTVKSPNGA